MAERVGDSGAVRRILPRVLLAAYLICLAVVALWPTPVDRDAGDVVSSIVSFVRSLGWSSFGYGHLEFAANVALFIPFGVLVAVATGRAWVGALTGLALSSAIEIAQGILLPERTPSISDVVANTLGGVLGALGLALVRALWRQRPPR